MTTKYYVEFRYPGSFFSNMSSKEIDHRTPTAARERPKRVLSLSRASRKRLTASEED